MLGLNEHARGTLVSMAMLTAMALPTVVWAQASGAKGTGAGNIEVTVGHLAPVASDATATAVDITLGDATFSGLEYGDFDTGMLDSGGDVPIEVTLAGGGSTLVSQTVHFGEGSMSYTLIVTGGANGLPIQLLNLSDATPAPADGRFKARIVHASPFDSDLADTAAGLRSITGEPLVDLGDPLLFAQHSGFISFEPSELDNGIKVTTGDGYTNLVDPLLPPASTLVGQVLNVVIAGDGERQPFQVFETNLLGGALDSRRVVDQTFSGEWFDPDIAGEGLSFRAIPRTNRLTGTWFTGSADGSRLLWFVLSSEPGDFVGTEAEVDIFQVTSELAFNTPRDEPDTEQVGTATVTFDPTCGTSAFDFDLSDIGLGNGSIELTAITGVCARSQPATIR